MENEKNSPETRRQKAELQKIIFNLQQENETLRESIDNFNIHFSMANDVMYTYDHQFRILRISPNVENLLGYKPEEMIGRTFQSLGVLDPTDVNEATEDALVILSGKSVLYSIYQFITKNGERKFGEVSGVPKRKDGKVVGVISVVRDITKRILAEEELKKYRDHLENLVSKRTDDLNQANAKLKQEIAEREKAEKALQESREFIRGITENIPGAVYQFYARDNGEMGVHYISGHAFELLGLDNEPDDFFRRVIASVASEDRDSLLDSIQEAVRNRSNWEHEVRFIKPMGGEVYIRGISKPRQLENELVFDGVMLDVTKRCLAQKVLLESEEKYRNLLRERDEILEGMGDGIIVFGMSGKVIHVNTAYERMTGLNRKDIVGKHGEELTHRTVKADEVDKIKQKFRSALAGESLPLITTTFIKGDGGEIPICFTASFIRAADGKPTAIIATIKDVSDLRRAEDALKESEERYRALVEGASDIFFRTDSTGRFTFVNSAAIHISGYSKEELIGEYYSKFTRRDMERNVCSSIEAQLEQRIPNSYQEYPIISKQGCEIWLGLRTQLMLEDGKVTGIQGIALNITERKRIDEEKATLENKNRQLQKAEGLNRMAGAIAHHFNNQLHMVTGYLSLALYDNKGADLLDLINKAQQSANKAAEMSLLMLTYLGQNISNHKPLDLSETCRRHLPILKSTLRKNINMETDFPSLGPIVNADEKQIQQVLTNLVTNAKESIGIDGGSIKLKIKVASLAEIPTSNRYPIGDQLQDQTYSCLEVIDNGHGISGEDMEKLFDPFFSTKFPSRGLGLPVVLGLVKVHQGVITVESNQGQGSAFRVFLPVLSL